MKLNMTKIAAAMVLLGSVGAHAAVDPASVTTATADLVFAEPAGAVTLTIVPEANLTAAKHPDKFKVASFTATPSDNADFIAMRFTPTVGTVDNSKDSATYDGKTDAKNKLTVHFTDPAGDGSTYDAASGYWHYPKAGAVSANINLKGEQTVAADTYTVSLDAGIWTA